MVVLDGPGVVYGEALPAPELRPWVAVCWRIRATAAFELRVLPDGCMDLIGGDVVGSLSRAFVATLAPGEVVEGARFRPGGLPALCGVPAPELVDARVPLEDLAPRRSSLRELARSAPPPDPLARAAYGARDLRALRRDSGYSERQLRRRVLAATGHAPKRLMRIARMQELLRAGRGESWARTAVERGFYDEAHMVNDVRELAGATPHALVR